MSNFNNDKKYHFLYKVTNLINGKYYVGMHSTNKLNDGYMGSGKILKRSLKKYGKENFCIEILEFHNSRKLLTDREKEFVNEVLISDTNCMNMINGGVGGFVDENHRNKFFELAKINAHKNGELGNDKFLELMKISKYREIHINKIKNGIGDFYLKNKGNFSGKRHCEKSKMMIGFKNKEKQSGERNSQYNTRWITNGIYNKKINNNDILPDGWVLGRKL